jgi:WD40 repeat protein/serine/threonine protein kinase
MSGPSSASRELRIALRALETGLLDDEQLADVVRAWGRSSRKSLTEILKNRRLVDEGHLAELEQQASRINVTSTEPEATVAYHRSPTAAAADGDGRPSQSGSHARFAMLRSHARGGLGEVFVAFDRELNRSVALKEVQARWAHDPDAQARFLREAEVTGRLEHPGIVPVYSLGRYADGRLFYAMRLVEGESLRDAIERFHQSRASTLVGDDRDPAFRRLLRSLIDACNAVAFAHSRGVIHRDLKPENIMLGPFGETLVVDWGLATAIGERSAHTTRVEAADRADGDPSITRPGSVLGTPRYMSPEQAAGALEQVGPASDVYSLGAILYYILVGHPSVPDGDLASVLNRVRRGIFAAPRRLRRSVDPGLESICLKAMALDPRERYASPLELAHEVEAWQADARYRGEQAAALGQVKESLSRLSLERAHSAFARSAHAEGMLWLARALEHAPPAPADLDGVIRMSLHAWHDPAKLLERSLRHAASIAAMAFSPDGRRLATAAADGTARLWDVSTGAPLVSPIENVGTVACLAFSPDGLSFVTAGDDGPLKVWDGLNGKASVTQFRHRGGASHVVFHPDGSRIAASGRARGSILWDAVSGATVVNARGGNRVIAVAFSCDGRILAVSRANGEVTLHDSAKGKPLGRPLAHESAALALAFVPASDALLTGGADGVVQMWEPGETRASLALRHEGAIRGLRVRPAGDVFAVSSDAGPARLWDLASGRPIGEPLAHRAGVDCLAFRPDGSIVVTGSRDGTIRIWCASTGLPIGPPLGHGGAVREVLFSHDGRRLASRGDDATVRCWTMPMPVEGTAERIGSWVRVTTELEFDAGDAIQPMDASRNWEARRRLSELGGPPIR